MKAADITKALHSRWALTVALSIMVASAYYALVSGVAEMIPGNKGTVFPSPALWIPDADISMWVNLAVIGAIAGLMIFINKAYNIPRTITLIYASFFVVLETATPDLTVRLCSATLLALVILASMTLMFSAYTLPSARRRVFLVFFMLSSALTVQYAFVIYIPVFLLACAQMKIFTFRTVLAALLGIITPWWILFGAGIVSPSDFHMPEFTSLFDSPDLLDTLIAAITAGLTVVLAITSYMLSLLKLITYNARMRACNGLLTIVTCVTVLAMIADFTNFICYLALLNCCTAFFLGHMFVIRNSPKAWIVISTITAIYYAIYIWIIFA
ncbi:MAG: hypothetical protein K2J12_08705 [Muribaculaceae bacterium]|nr:hypothetical protein [Muribaculaceae bacterium]